MKYYYNNYLMLAFSFQIKCNSNSHSINVKCFFNISGNKGKKLTIIFAKENAEHSLFSRSLTNVISLLL